MKYTLLTLILVLFSSCENNFKTPNPVSINLDLEANTSMNSVIRGLNSFEENIITFTDDLLIEGYVVSSDKAGNFYNELIIQDSTENPNTGIAIQIDENSLFEKFPFGSKIYIQLNGLSIGYQNGVIELGRLKENEIETLTEFLIDEHIFRSGEVLPITPIPVLLSAINEDYLNLYITLKNMQFPLELLDPIPITLAAENTDSFDGLRPMLNCNENLELMLSTSVFSNFKTLTLPSNSGEVNGVLTRDFFDLLFVLKMNSANDLSFTSESRCENDYFECEQNNFNPLVELFKEDFDRITNENQLDDLDWLNINSTGDEKRWTDKKITNIDNRVLTLSAFNSDLSPLNVWLVTPEINATNQEEIFFECRLRTFFNNGDALKIWVTDNFIDDINTTNWELLPVDLPSSSSNYITIKHNISCLSGNIRIALEYNGYDPLITSTYDIDEIIIYGNTTPQE